MSTVDQVFSAQGLWKWYSSRTTQGFNNVNEKGMDFSTAFGTPVGSITSGTVVRITHNNNAINDQVEIKTPSGAVLLYQHITSHVSVGQAIGVGTVVGTENGLPVDQYSTGPHIEVRYCPSGWSIATNNWNEPWVNPAGFYASIGGQQASTVTGSPPPGTVSYTTGLTYSTPAVRPTYTGLLEQVHQTLINAPGFYGIALALDEAEQFPGWIDLTVPQQDISVAGIDTGFAPPDVTGLVRSTGATLYDNTMPFMIRSGLITIGGILVIALLIKIVEQPAERAVQMVGPIVGAMA